MRQLGLYWFSLWGYPFQKLEFISSKWLPWFPCDSCPFTVCAWKWLRREWLQWQRNQRERNAAGGRWLLGTCTQEFPRYPRNCCIARRAKCRNLLYAGILSNKKLDSLVLGLGGLFNWNASALIPEVSKRAWTAISTQRMFVSCQSDNAGPPHGASPRPGKDGRNPRMRSPCWLERDAGVVWARLVRSSPNVCFSSGWFSICTFASLRIVGGI